MDKEEISYYLKEFASSFDAFDKCRTNLLIKNMRLEENFSQLSHSIVDAGCGTADMLRILTKDREGLRVGLDLSFAALKVAKALSKHEIEFVHGDAHCLPFRSESFTCVIAGELIEHLADDFKFMAEIFRVLKPYGIVVLSTPSGKKLTIDDIRQGHVRLYTYSQLEELLKKTGFCRIEITKWGFIFLRFYFHLRKLIIHRKGFDRFISHGREDVVADMKKSTLFQVYQKLLPFVVFLLQLDKAPTQRTAKHLIIRAVKPNVKYSEKEA